MISEAIGQSFVAWVHIIIPRGFLLVEIDLEMWIFLGQFQVVSVHSFLSLYKLNQIDFLSFCEIASPTSSQLLAHPTVKPITLPGQNKVNKIDKLDKHRLDSVKSRSEIRVSESTTVRKNWLHF